MRIIKNKIKTSRGVGYIMECIECKKDFRIKKWDYDNLNKGKFCSNKCRGTFQKTNFNGSNNPNWKGGKVQIRCIVCNKRKMVKRKDIKNGRGKCCSIECKNIANSKKMKDYYKKNPEHKNKTKHVGCKNGRWLGGKSFEPYSSDFNKELKEKIKIRDGKKCRVCKKIDKMLNVHHIDYNKQNNNPKNLISLCPKCHGKTNTKRDYWKKCLSDLI